MILVEDAIETIRPFAFGGGCDDDAEILSLINRAHRYWWDLGDWTDTYGIACIQTCDTCIHLPRGVKALRRVKFGEDQAQPGSQVFSWLSYGWDPADGSGWCAPDTLQYRGTFPTYKDICEPSRILAIADREMKGNTITIIGADGTGLNAREELPVGFKAEGLNATFYTKSDISRITNLIRRGDNLAGYVYVAIYDPDTLEYTVISEFAPGEKSPSFRRYSISGKRTDQTIRALCKREFIDHQDGEEILAIQNLAWLEYAVRAIAAHDKSQWDVARNHGAEARMLLAEVSKSQDYGINEQDVSPSWGGAGVTSGF